MMLKDIRHCGPWYGPGSKERGNILGKIQVESFLDNTNLRIDFFKHHNA